MTSAVVTVNMCSGYGHVTTISSVAGLFGSIKLVDYCCSKFAVMGLIEALRFEIVQEVRNTAVLFR